MKIIPKKNYMEKHQKLSSDTLRVSIGILLFNGEKYLTRDIRLYSRSDLSRF